MSRIELGKNYPSLDRLMRIAEVLKVSLPKLFDFIHLSDGETRAQSLEGSWTRRRSRWLTGFAGQIDAKSCVVHT